MLLIQGATYFDTETQRSVIMVKADDTDMTKVWVHPVGLPADLYCVRIPVLTWGEKKPYAYPQR
jgi:hypothetical protein